MPVKWGQSNLEIMLSKSKAQCFEKIVIRALNLSRGFSGTLIFGGQRDISEWHTNASIWQQNIFSSPFSSVFEDTISSTEESPGHWLKLILSNYGPSDVSLFGRGWKGTKVWVNQSQISIYTYWTIVEK